MKPFSANTAALVKLEDTLKPESYSELAKDWYIIVTDVQNSTQAIEAGLYREINAIGGSTIAAVLNALKPNQVPYVFGGDGASFCVPANSLEKVKQALKGCQEIAQQIHNLNLRVGLIAYQELTSPIHLCKYQASENLHQYFFMGGGMEEADSKIKASSHYHLDPSTLANADFSGFECRWNSVPSAKEITFSLLVKARTSSEMEALKTYDALIEKIHLLFGDVQDYHPLNTKGLSLSLSADKLNVELLTKTQHQNLWQRWFTLQKLRMQNLIATYLMKFGKIAMGSNWGEYKQDLVINSDFIKIDDTYRTVMSAEQKTLNELIEWLEGQYQAGRLFYGYHTSHSAIITCLINKTGIDHIHFVDCAEGGYTMAAKQLKTQIKSTV
ncbi:hypothetical protein THMIRHAM_21930 [Thiomicrorhabdus immobilis]|uniref:DUF3095 domain-containing protein n=1 Tax=Thiomicrorhabdus immobilis TaxID=2791037 RepID=A0ABN6CZC7_9GAMM|nr:DUF3095 family protein [Thiomicrorhabdus immobilis]BCN94408.1 hypothetical protein THMIRHAM_21930 [Thiomicrorhabdus immobilis]